VVVNPGRCQLSRQATGLLSPVGMGAAQSMRLTGVARQRRGVGPEASKSSSSSFEFEFELARHDEKIFAPMKNRVTRIELP